jgi:hypothetical protein
MKKITSVNIRGLISSKFIGKSMPNLMQFRYVCPAASEGLSFPFVFLVFPG